MSKSTLLNSLLSNFLRMVPDLTAALIVDVEGLIIAQQSVKEFDEEIISAIMAVLEQTISKIKRYAETSFGSGTFDTNEFRLFYLELGGVIPAIFVLIADPYANIDNIIPYSYIVAEKISSILSNYKTKISLPRLLENGEIELKSEVDSISVKNVINKIVVLGDDAVGKSTLLDMYVKGECDHAYKATIGLSIMEKELQITKRMKVTFFLFDMGGIQSFIKVRRNFYNNSNAIMILFDFTRPETLNNVVDWLKEAKIFIKDNSIPYILVGNKIDLVENQEEIKKKAIQIANQFNFVFFATSALTGEGLDELFMYLLNFASNQVM